MDSESIKFLWLGKLSPNQNANDLPKAGRKQNPLYHDMPRGVVWNTPLPHCLTRSLSTWPVPAVPTMGKNQVNAQ